MPKSGGVTGSVLPTSVEKYWKDRMQLVYFIVLRVAVDLAQAETHRGARTGPVPGVLVRYLAKPATHWLREVLQIRRLHGCSKYKNRVCTT